MMDKTSSELILPPRVCMYLYTLFSQPVPLLAGLVFIGYKLGMGREPLLELRKRDNLLCTLNNPMLWQEKVTLLPRDWRRAFLDYAEGELLILSPSNVAFCYIALWIIEPYPCCWILQLCHTA